MHRRLACVRTVKCHQTFIILFLAAAGRHFLASPALRPHLLFLIESLVDIAYAAVISFRNTPGMQRAVDASDTA